MARRHSERGKAGSGKSGSGKSDLDPRPDPEEFVVSEIANDVQGASSPFGPGVVFPLDIEQVGNKWVVRKQVDKH